MPYQTPGFPRIALLDANGNKIKWNYLPMPDKGQPTTEWIEKGQVETLVDGSEANRRLGFVPQVTFRWKTYVDQITASFQETVTSGAWGIVVGSLPGQMLSMQGLLTLLSSPPGSISISPGPTAGGFVVQSAKIKPIGVNPLGQAEGVEIVFRGGTILPSMVLGAF